MRFKCGQCYTALKFRKNMYICHNCICKAKFQYLLFSNLRSPIAFILYYRIKKISILDKIPNLNLVYKRNIQLLLIQINTCGKCLRLCNGKRVKFTYWKNRLYCTESVSHMIVIDCTDHELLHKQKTFKTAVNYNQY